MTEEELLSPRCVEEKSVKKSLKNVPVERIYEITDTYIAGLNSTFSSNLVYGKMKKYLSDTFPSRLLQKETHFIELSQRGKIEEFLFESYPIIFSDKFPIIKTEDKISNGKNYYRAPKSQFVVQVAKNVYIIRTLMPYSHGSEQHYHAVFTEETPDKIKESIKKFVPKMVNDFADFMKKTQNRKTDLSILDKVFLSKELKEDLIEDIQSFITGKQIYKELGLPWKRGYVFSGNPGNGKTLSLRLLSRAFGLEMHDLLDYLNPKTGELDLETADDYQENSIQTYSGIDLYEMSKHAWERKVPIIYYLEDMDKIVGVNEKDFAKMTLSNLLNAIDGVERLADGFLLIATTNFLKDLAEPVIGRPGRFDRVFEFENPKKQEIKDFLAYHSFETSDNSDEKIIDHLNGLTMAFVEEFIKSAKMIYKKNKINFEQAKKIIQRMHNHNEIKNKMLNDFGFRP